MATKKQKEEEDKKDVNIFESGFVPKHELLTDEQKKEFLTKMNIALKQLPRIKSNDPAVKIVGGKRGDIIKITRNSPVAGDYYYYRVVV